MTVFSAFRRIELPAAVDADTDSRRNRPFEIEITADDCTAALPWSGSSSPQRGDCPGRTLNRHESTP